MFSCSGNGSQAARRSGGTGVSRTMNARPVSLSLILTFGLGFAIGACTIGAPASRYPPPSYPPPGYSGPGYPAPGNGYPPLVAPIAGGTSETVVDEHGRSIALQHGPPGDPRVIGCADGRREVFLDPARFPHIAGCLGTWAGAQNLRSPATGQPCGDELGPCTPLTSARPAGMCAAAPEPSLISARSAPRIASKPAAADSPPRFRTVRSSTAAPLTRRPTRTTDVSPTAGAPSRSAAEPIAGSSGFVGTAFGRSTRTSPLARIRDAPRRQPTERAAFCAARVDAIGRLAVGEVSPTFSEDRLRTCREWRRSQLVR